MKVRVKLSGTSKAVDVGEVDQCTLLQLQQTTADVFQLRETPFSLSLNKIDALRGEDQTLSQLGIVPGDMIFIICLEQDLSYNHPPTNTSDKAAASSSSSSSNCDSYTEAINEYDTLTPHGSDVSCNDGGSVWAATSSGQVPGTGSQAASEETAAVVCSSDDRESSSPCPLEDPEVNRCLQEPLLCRESTSSSVPALLRDVFSAAACRTMTDAVWVVIHTLMLEVGFRPLQDGDLSLGEGWNSRGFYKQEYNHLCVDAPHSCSVIGVPMGPVLIVHGVTSADPPLKTDPHQVKMADYVQSSNVNQDVCLVYKNLERLSHSVKDLICQRLMSQLSEVCGFPVSVGMLCLSYEVKLKLLSYLPASSITRVGQVCRDFNVTYRDPCLWRRLYLREFGQNGDNNLNKNWYQLYKDAYQMRKERRRLSRHRQTLYTGVPPWLSPMPGNFPPLVPAPFPIGTIGGDYDLNPEFASSIPHPLMGGRPRGPNPFFPNGPQNPGGPFLPRPRFDDPFAPGFGPGPPFLGLGGARSRNSRSSPFSAFGGRNLF